MCYNWEDQVEEMKGWNCHHTNSHVTVLGRFEETSTNLGPLLWKVDYEGHLWLFVMSPLVSYPSFLSSPSFSLFSAFLWQITGIKLDFLIPSNLKGKGTGSTLLATIYGICPSRDLPCGSFDPLSALLLPIFAAPQDLGRKKQISDMLSSKSRLN